jgi:hypothetical protein
MGDGAGDQVRDPLKRWQGDKVKGEELNSSGQRGLWWHVFWGEDTLRGLQECLWQ